MLGLSGTLTVGGEAHREGDSVGRTAQQMPSPQLNSPLVTCCDERATGFWTVHSCGGQIKVLTNVRARGIIAPPADATWSVIRGCGRGICSSGSGRTCPRCGHGPTRVTTSRWRPLGKLHGLTDTAGTALQFTQTHRLRHTRAIELLNDSVPIYFVQRSPGTRAQR
jgi:hypothetical protein